MNSVHKDCANYTAVDVFKGHCRRLKEIKMADETGCECFTPARMCKFCSHYTSREEFLGLCMEHAVVYPDLPAKTCADFLRKSDG